MLAGMASRVTLDSLGSSATASLSTQHMAAEVTGSTSHARLMLWQLQKVVKMVPLVASRTLSRPLMIIWEARGAT